MKTFKKLSLHDLLQCILGLPHHGGCIRIVAANILKHPLYREHNYDVLKCLVGTVGNRFLNRVGVICNVHTTCAYVMCI